MNRLMKIGLIGLTLTVGVSFFLRIKGISLSNSLPLTLPWMMVILISIAQKGK